MTSTSISPFTLVAALVAGGVAGAIAATWLAPGPPSNAAPLLVTEATTLERRLAVLEQRLDGIAEQLAAWKTDTTPIEPLTLGDALASLTDTPKSAATPQDVEAADVATTSIEGANAPASTAFYDEVATALEQIRRDEKVDGWRDHVQAKRDGIDASMSKLTERLELNEYQVTELRHAILAHYDREDAVISAWDRGVADDLVGRQKEEAGQLFTAEVASFLTEEQNTSFWELIAQSKGGG